MAGKRANRGSKSSRTARADLWRRVHALTSFVELSCRIKPGDSSRRVFQQLLLAAMGSTGASAGAVFRVVERGTVRLVDAFGPGEEGISRTPIPLAPSLERELRQGTTVRFFDEKPGDQWQDLLRALAFPFRPLALMRLDHRNRLAGMIFLGERIREGSFGQDEKKLLGALAGVFCLLAEKYEISLASPKKGGRVTACSPGDLRDRYPQLSSCVGTSASMRRILSDLTGVATTDCPLLIEGDSGTGKELLARIAHEIGCGDGGPFEAISCGAIPETLMESELFGHVAGSFTGATRDHQGVFERARAGTVFLDEIGEMSLPAQVKLLRVLQDGSFLPVGGERLMHCHSRVIAATNRDLRREVDAGRFRKDLFYRLNVFPIRVPPLRDRREDIPLLVEHFLETYSGDLGRPCPSIQPTAMRRLCVYSYPGNVRELQNIVRTLLVELQGGTRITDRHVVAVFSRHRLGKKNESIAPPEESSPTPSGNDVGSWVLSELRRYYFNLALADRMLDRRKRAAGDRHSVPVSSRSGLTYYLQGEFMRALAGEKWDAAAAAKRVAGGTELLPRVRGKLDRFLDTAVATWKKGGTTPRRRMVALKRRLSKLPECYEPDMKRFVREIESGRWS